MAGGCAWQGGVRGRGPAWQGACMAGGLHGRGHAWQGACMAGGCVWQGGVCGRGHAWQGVCMLGGMHGGGGMHGRGVCMAGGRVWQILRDTVNERAVRILLECILVVYEVSRRSTLFSLVPMSQNNCFD